MSETNPPVETIAKLSHERYELDRRIQKLFVEADPNRAARLAAEQAAEAAFDQDNHEHAERARAHYAARQAAKHAAELDSNRLLKGISGLTNGRYSVVIEPAKDGGKLLTVWDDAESVGMAWRITGV